MLATIGRQCLPMEYPYKDGVPLKKATREAIAGSCGIEFDDADQTWTPIDGGFKDSSKRCSWAIVVTLVKDLADGRTFGVHASCGGVLTLDRSSSLPVSGRINSRIFFC